MMEYDDPSSLLIDPRCVSEYSMSWSFLVQVVVLSHLAIIIGPFAHYYDSA